MCENQKIDEYGKAEITPYGKVTIIKSRLLSKISHMLLSLQALIFLY